MVDNKNVFFFFYIYSMKTTNIKIDIKRKGRSDKNFRINWLHKYFSFYEKKKTQIKNNSRTKSSF
jgi:hypothetical protein